jgi:hypothetical protein
MLITSNTIIDMIIKKGKHDPYLGEYNNRQDYLKSVEVIKLLGDYSDYTKGKNTLRF